MLIEVLVLLRLALLLKGSDGTGVLLILKAEGDGRAAPPPFPRVFLLPNGCNKEDTLGLLTLTLSHYAADRATDAALLVIVSIEVQ